jgi:hypothetical protein
MSPKRDHSDEHGGCNRVFPWLRGCSLWTNKIILSKCISDIENMSLDSRQKHYSYMSKNRSIFDKATSKCAYIATSDGWRLGEVELDQLRARRQGEIMSWSEAQIEVEVENLFNSRLQYLAHEILFLYGMLDRQGSLKSDE